MRRWLVGILVCLFGFEGAAADNAQEVLEKVRRKYDGMADAQLTFTQRTRFEMSRIEQSAEGTLLLKKTNKYRVEFGDRTIVTNGVTVWSYSVPNNQVLIDHFKSDERMFTPERLLTGAPRDFYATLTGKEKVERADALVLKLVPKDDHSFVRSLKLWVDASSWLILKVELTEVSGKETTYQISDAKLNTGIADGRFTYQIPEGVEVIDLR